MPDKNSNNKKLNPSTNVDKKNDVLKKNPSSIFKNSVVEVSSPEIQKENIPLEEIINDKNSIKKNPSINFDKKKDVSKKNQHSILKNSTVEVSSNEIQKESIHSEEIIKDKNSIKKNPSTNVDKKKDASKKNQPLILNNSAVEVSSNKIQKESIHSEEIINDKNSTKKKLNSSINVNKKKDALKKNQHSAIKNSVVEVSSNEIQKESIHSEEIINNKNSNNKKLNTSTNIDNDVLKKNHSVLKNFVTEVSFPEIQKESIQSEEIININNENLQQVNKDTLSLTSDDQSLNNNNFVPLEEKKLNFWEIYCQKKQDYETEDERDVYAKCLKNYIKSQKKRRALQNSSSANADLSQSANLTTLDPIAKNEQTLINNSNKVEASPASSSIEKKANDVTASNVSNNLLLENNTSKSKQKKQVHDKTSRKSKKYNNKHSIANKSQFNIFFTPFKRQNENPWLCSSKELMNLRKKNRFLKLKKYLNGVKYYRIAMWDKRQFQNYRRLNTCVAKSQVINAVCFQEKLIKKINIKVSQNNIFCTLSNIKNKLQPKIINNGWSGSFKIGASRRKLRNCVVSVIKMFFSKILKHNIKNFNHTVFKIIAPIKIRRQICYFLRKQFFKPRPLLISRAKRLKLRNLKIRMIFFQQLKRVILRRLVKNGKVSKELAFQKYKEYAEKTTAYKKKIEGNPKYRLTHIYSHKNTAVRIIHKKCFNGCKARKKLRKKRKAFRILK
jgi:hypothetical protein